MPCLTDRVMSQALVELTSCVLLRLPREHNNGYDSQGQACQSTQCALLGAEKNKAKMYIIHVPCGCFVTNILFTQFLPVTSENVIFCRKTMQWAVCLSMESPSSFSHRGRSSTMLWMAKWLPHTSSSLLHLNNCDSTIDIVCIMITSRNFHTKYKEIYNLFVEFDLKAVCITFFFSQRFFFNVELYDLIFYTYLLCTFIYIRYN